MHLVPLWFDEALILQSWLINTKMPGVKDPSLEVKVMVVIK